MNAIPDENHEPDGPELSLLYRDFKRENLIPLWTEIEDLMPMVPAPKAVPHVWRWSDLYPLAPAPATWFRWAAAANAGPSPWPTPACPGTAYATPTLWAAIQYLGPHETAPEHRH